jgi:hypothetical protein
MFSITCRGNNLVDTHVLFTLLLIAVTGLALLVGWGQFCDLRIVLTKLVNTIVVGAGGGTNVRLIFDTLPLVVQLPCDFGYLPAELGDVSLGVREYVSIYDPSPHKSRDTRVIGKKSFIVAESPRIKSRFGAESGFSGRTVDRSGDKFLFCNFFRLFDFAHSGHKSYGWSISNIFPMVCKFDHFQRWFLSDTIDNVISGKLCSRFVLNNKGPLDRVERFSADLVGVAHGAPLSNGDSAIDRSGHTSKPSGISYRLLYAVTFLLGARIFYWCICEANFGGNFYGLAEFNWWALTIGSFLLMMGSVAMFLNSFSNAPQFSKNLPANGHNFLCDVVHVPQVSNRAVTGLLVCCFSISSRLQRVSHSGIKLFAGIKLYCSVPGTLLEFQRGQKQQTIGLSQGDGVFKSIVVFHAPVQRKELISLLNNFAVSLGEDCDYSRIMRPTSSCRGEFVAWNRHDSWFADQPFIGPSFSGKNKLTFDVLSYYMSRIFRIQSETASIVWRDIKSHNRRLCTYGLLPHQSGLVLHFCKLIAHSTQLSSCNDGIINSSKNGSEFYQVFPPWRLIWSAMFSIGISFWGWWNIRNNRRVMCGFASFVFGLFLWGYSINSWLDWWLKL